jgi:CHAT domain-containing protein
MVLRSASPRWPGSTVLTFSALILVAACGERPVERRTASAISPFHLADSLREDGRFAEALPRYRALRDSFAQVGDSASLWQAQLWWAEALLRSGKRDSAQAALDQEMVWSKGNRAREGWTLYVRSLLLHRQGKLDSALQASTAAIARARAIKDRELEARSLSVVGTVHSLSGRYRLAAAETERALAVRRELKGSKRALATQLSNLGIEYRHLGRFSDAQRVFQEAVGHLAGSPSPRVGMLLQANFANLKRTTGDLDAAVDLFHESLRAAEQLGDAQGLVMAPAQIGSLYLERGNRAAARPYLERALEAGRQMGAAYNQLIALQALGRLELAEGKLDQASATLAAGLALADSAGFGQERSGGRVALARVAIAQKDGRAALQWADAAIAIADSLNDPAAQFDALEVRAAALELLRHSRAPTGYRLALELLESWRGRLALGDLRMGVAAPRLGAYEGAIRTLLAQGRAEEALEIAERARARLLLELMAERDASGAARSRREELIRLVRERFEARTAVAQQDRKAALDREIAQLTDSIAAVEAEERHRDPAGAAHHPTPASLAELRAGLLVPNAAALLSFFWGDSAVYGWWVTADTVRAARLGSADSLSALVDFLRSTLDRPPVDELWAGAARAAYQRLIEPLAADAVERIFVVADGPLAHVPLEVFIPGGDAQPWGATRRIIYGPSASVLAALGQARRRNVWERAVLAVGNPALGAGRAPLRALVRAGMALSRDRLPYAEQEARAIGDLFRPMGADLLLGAHATMERWLAFEPARYRYLHFAAHAEVSDRRPEETRLVLAGGGLDLAAIRGLRLQSDLVTLSACETALGRRVRGEGVIGLSHAFLAAGARATLVTLWRIGDRSAADFMRDFYQELYTGPSPSEALLAVRRRWISSGGAKAHPSRWAPFILVGGIPLQ